MTEIAIIEFARLHQDAKLPRRQRLNDAGFDLYAYFDDGTPERSEGRLLKPMERVLIKTGLAPRSCPDDVFMHILPRSGLSLKNGLHVMGGVVDASYRDEIGVILINLGDQSYVVRHEDRVAQMCFVPLVKNMGLSIESYIDGSKVPESTRTGGFGSSDLTFDEAKQMAESAGFKLVLKPDENPEPLKLDDLRVFAQQNQAMTANKSDVDGDIQTQT
jgi:dUTP pyrophosphatase